MLNKPIKPMLLQPSGEVMAETGWLHSLKWDGIRILLHYDNGKTRAFTRHGNEVTQSFFPELDRIKLPIQNAIFDGEAICLNPQTSPPSPCWEDVMSRSQTKKEQAVRQASVSKPVHFIIWDMLFYNNRSILIRDFLERRQLLERAIVNTDEISVTTLYEDGQSLFMRAKELGLEGICSYNVKPGGNSHYYLDSRPGNVWVKTKAYQYAKCQITSIRKSKFGWGLSVDGRYVGMLEFPPSSSIVKEVYRRTNQIIREENNEWIILDPGVSARIKFQCYTKAGKLRSPKLEELCS
ncbi:DNA ligase [Brevibacillus sp. AG]|uniref:ATP-dependent DNA ligase n=1 Tax=Brevibacillus sp. AG TaxID=3020891 RepID=UPI00232E3F5B|nr:DNA ligase [Brevibacillus sp. AG]MDC0764906.1 DNA ligase [Brevibacillus sp. AG]